MKQTPIIFTDPFPSAIRNGIKTQTRRLNGLEKINEDPDNYWFRAYNFLEKPYRFDKILPVNDNTIPKKSILPVEIACPFGKPYDHLIVKEKFQVIGWNWDDSSVKIKYSDGDTAWCYFPVDTEENREKWEAWLHNISLKYIDLKGAKFTNIDGHPTSREDYIREADEYNQIDLSEAKIPFRPSIHMPLWASLLELKIIKIHPERVMDITETDAIAEGITQIGNGFKDYMNPGKILKDPRLSFFSLWKSLYGARLLMLNPWVWRIEFENFPF